MISAGARRHYVELFRLGAAIPDGTGYSHDPEPLNPPAMWADVQPATARVTERHFAGTVVAAATVIVTLPYHPQITTATVIHHAGRVLSVVGVASPGDRGIETVCACTEVEA